VGYRNAAPISELRSLCTDGAQSTPLGSATLQCCGAVFPLALRHIIGLNIGLVRACICAYHGGMRILPISKMKDKLNEYVDAVAQTQDQITITKNGAPAAVLVGADEWESLQETLYWLSQPGIKESLAEADADIAAGRTYGEDEIRAEFGVPRRTD
jgi:antitoxin YefM